jgi:hypothetical protein
MGMMIAYVVVDQTGAGQYILGEARVTQTDHAEAWTQHIDQHIPIDDHGGEIIIPQTIEYPESWTFAIETSYGTVSMSFNQPDAAKLLCCQYVRIKYRLGRLSHSPFGLSIRL